MDFTLENLKDYFEFVDYYYEMHSDDAQLGLLNKLTRSSAKSLLIKNRIMTNAQKAASFIRTNGRSDEIRTSITSLIYDSFDYARKFVDDTVTVIFDVSDGTAKNILSSMFMVLLIYIINTFVHTIAGLLFGPLFGSVIGGCVCAPIVEEYAKQMAIRGGFVKEFTVVFNALEFSLYFHNFLPKMTAMYGRRIAIKSLALMRTMAVGLHLTTTMTQFFFKNKADILRAAPELMRDPEQDKKLQNAGYFAGVFLHSAWNTTATVLDIVSKAH